MSLNLNLLRNKTTRDSTIPNMLLREIKMAKAKLSNPFNRLSKLPQSRVLRRRSSRRRSPWSPVKTTPTTKAKHSIEWCSIERSRQEAPQLPNPLKPLRHLSGQRVSVGRSSQAAAFTKTTVLVREADTLLKKWNTIRRSSMKLRKTRRNKQMITTILAHHSRSHRQSRASRLRWLN